MKRPNFDLSDIISANQTERDKALIAAMKKIVVPGLAKLIDKAAEQCVDEFEEGAFARYIAAYLLLNHLAELLTLQTIELSSTIHPVMLAPEYMDEWFEMWSKLSESQHHD